MGLHIKYLRQQSDKIKSLKKVVMKVGDVFFFLIFPWFRVLLNRSFKYNIMVKTLFRYKITPPRPTLKNSLTTNISTSNCPAIGTRKSFNVALTLHNFEVRTITLVNIYNIFRTQNIVERWVLSDPLTLASIIAYSLLSRKTFSREISSIFIGWSLEANIKIKGRLSSYLLFALSEHP